LNVQGMSPAQASQAQHHQPQQIVYLSNGQPMVVVQQPQSLHEQQHQGQLGAGMQEWRQGLMTPMEEQAEMEWAPAAVVDVG
jgi:hypothetical protein